MLVEEVVALQKESWVGRQKFWAIGGHMPKPTSGAEEAQVKGMRAKTKGWIFKNFSKASGAAIAGDIEEL